MDIVKAFRKLLTPKKYWEGEVIEQVLRQGRFFVDPRHRAGRPELQCVAAARRLEHRGILSSGRIAVFGHYVVAWGLARRNKDVSALLRR